MALATVTTAGLRPLPLSLLSQAIPMLTRDELEDVIERLIDRLDCLDPDADIEANGDELDASAGEDDYLTGSEGAVCYPGCPISDPDTAADDLPCDEDFDREPDADTGLTCSYDLDQTRWAGRSAVWSRHRAGVRLQPIAPPKPLASLIGGR